jgi:hypothetical protein
MSRNKHINWLCTQGTTNVEIRTLEKLAGESDTLHDAVCLIIWGVINTEDDSYDFVEGTDFPLRIRFDKEGLSVLAPCIHAGEPGAPAVVRGDLKWEKMTDFEVEQLVHLAIGLQKQRHTLAEAHLDEAIAAQAQLTRYRVRFRGEETQEEMSMVIWDNDDPELENNIRDNFGDRLVSLKHLGPMKSF